MCPKLFTIMVRGTRGRSEAFAAEPEISPPAGTFVMIMKDF
jgi:hypothetical protein